MNTIRNQIITSAMQAGRLHLTEPEAKLLCKQYSIEVPEFEIVRTEEEAFDVSRKIGFPLVAKIISPNISHKTDAHGVVLGIKSADEAKKAFATILTRTIEFDSRASVEGVMLERMEPRGIETIIGATRDPAFGMVLMFGLGGVFVEVFRDVTFRLAPITELEAKSMIDDIHARQLLSGFRGSFLADKSAITRTLLNVSKLVSENEEIVGLDLNPTIVYEKGAVAVDARIVLSEMKRGQTESRPPPSSMVNFFKAKSVAVVGASAAPGKIGHEILKSVSQYEYSGKVYPINPTSESILGLKAYPSILEVPETIDLAVLTVSSRLVPSIMDACGRKGVRNVVVVSGGFKETGLEDLEKETIETARKYGIRVIGPNCIGVLDGHSRLDTFFQSRDRMLRPKPGSVAFITQSGTFGATILEWAAEEGIGISKFVSYGNKCDVDEADLVEFFGQDSETTIVGIYVEGVGKGRKLYDIARKVSPKKPIVVMKAGRTRLGSKAAKSHTGWLAGSYEVARAAFSQSGMIVAESVSELFGVIKGLAMQPLPSGPAVAMVTNGAGLCVLAADRIEDYGMMFAPLSRDTLSELARSLPPYCYFGETTIDLTGSATSKDYETALTILSRDPGVHILMPFFVFQDTPLDEGIVEAIGRVRDLGKTVICCAAGGPFTRKMSERIETLNVPVYDTAEMAVAVAHALLCQARTQKSPAWCETVSRSN